MTESAPTRELVFFDLESGGRNPLMDCVIQIAAIAVAWPSFEQIETFEVKIRFNESAADPEALAINSYDRETWQNEAVYVRQAVKEFTAFLERHATKAMTSKKGNPYRIAELAGHNVSRFDMSFLCAMYGDEFLPAAFLTFDTLQLAQWWELMTCPDLENLRLGTLAEFFGVDLGEAHDALADVKANVEICRALFGEMRAEWPL